MYFRVLNDLSSPEIHGFDFPIGCTVGVMTYLPSIDSLDNTVFTDITITNHGVEVIDSSAVSMFLDINMLECPFSLDIGSRPDNNLAFFTETNHDSCTVDFPGEGSRFETTLIQLLSAANPETAVNFSLGSVVPLYRNLDALGNAQPTLSGPQAPHEYYRSFTGNFWNGSPMYAQGRGFTSDGSITETLQNRH